MSGEEAASLAAYLADPALALPPPIAAGAAAVAVSAIHREREGCTFNLCFGDLAGRPLYSVSLYPERGAIIVGQEVAPA